MTTKTNPATARLIRWEELLQRLSDAPPPLSERAFLTLLLKAANGRELTPSQWSQLAGLDASPRERPMTPQTRRSLVMSLVQVIAVQSSPRRRPAMYSNGIDLTHAVLPGFDQAALRQMNSALLTGSVVIVPHWTPEGRKDRIVTNGIVGAIFYGIHLLSDKGGRFANTLCRCEYSKCQKFFLKRQAASGAPVRTYCSPIHYRPGDREKAVERMKSLRGDQKRRSSKPRRMAK